MFEDKYMIRFIYAFLGVASIIIPGPIVPIISFIIAIAILVYKIKKAKNSQEDFMALMFDIILIIIVIVVDIGFFAMRISIDHEYNKYNYSSSSSQDMTAEDFAEGAIFTYRADNLSLFMNDGNHLSKIRNGFVTYLKDELGVTDVTVKGTKIICKVREDTIIFTVSKNNIQYSIK